MLSENPDSDQDDNLDDPDFDDCDEQVQVADVRIHHDVLSATRNTIVEHKHDIQINKWE